jgi:hypothetical protein
MTPGRTMKGKENARPHGFQEDHGPEPQDHRRAR